MRPFRITAILAALLLASFPLCAQRAPSGDDVVAVILPEPVLPEPVAAPIASSVDGVARTGTPSAANDGPEAYDWEAPILSPEGLPLPGIREPAAPSVSEQPAALVLGRVSQVTRLDPGYLGPVGSRTPGDTPPDDTGPTTPTDDALPDGRVPVAPKLPDGWTLTWPEVARESGGVVANKQIIAYYGHPFSRFMGVLGEKPIEEMAADLLASAAEYDELNGPIGVAPAFHIIYGTVWEDGDIGILRESKLREYIEYARDHGIIVFLDHQIGRYTVDEAIASMLPYLKYEHVHLAIDPEWATAMPGREIGRITAEELNRAQETISNYLVENNIPGPKMLVVHQFNWRMIANREQVRTDYPGVQLIHNADGFGRPAEKYVSWEYNVQASNMPLKGFKLFYPKSWRDGGYDDPLLSPVEVMQLQPVPVYIQYQ